MNDDWERLHRQRHASQAAKERDAFFGATGFLVFSFVAAFVGFWGDWSAVTGLACGGAVLSALAMAVTCLAWAYHALVASRRPSGIESWDLDGSPVPLTPDLEAFLFFARQGRAAAIRLERVSPEQFSGASESKRARLRCARCGARWSAKACGACRGERAVVFLEGSVSAGRMKRLGVRNRGARRVTLAAETGAAWLTVSPVSAVLEPGGSVELSVTADAAGAASTGAPGLVVLQRDGTVFAEVEVLVGSRNERPGPVS